MDNFAIGEYVLSDAAVEFDEFGVVRLRFSGFWVTNPEAVELHRSTVWFRTRLN